MAGALLGGGAQQLLDFLGGRRQVLDLAVAGLVILEGQRIEFTPRVLGVEREGIRSSLLPLLQLFEDHAVVFDRLLILKPFADSLLNQVLTRFASIGQGHTNLAGQGNSLLGGGLGMFLSLCFSFLLGCGLFLRSFGCLSLQSGLDLLGRQILLILRRRWFWFCSTCKRCGHASETKLEVL